MAEMTYLQAISDGLRTEMRRDKRVFVIGEDVGVYGGAFKVTLGFQEEFGPWRVIDAPLAETAIVGAAHRRRDHGHAPGRRDAVRRLRLVRAGTTSSRSPRSSTTAPALPVPIVVRLPSGGGFSGGPFHSQNPESSFAHIPGLKCVCPATPEDAKGLLDQRDRGSEPGALLRAQAPLPPDQGRGARRALHDADRQGAHAPRGRRRHGDHLGRDGLHRRGGRGAARRATASRSRSSTCARSCRGTRRRCSSRVRKTSKVLVLHEDTRTGGFGAEIAATIAEEAFEDLDAPVRRIAAPDTPVPFSPPLEKAFIPQVDDVVAGPARARGVLERTRWRRRPQIDVVMPQMGVSVSEGTITKWLKQRGRARSRRTSRCSRSRPTRSTPRCRARRRASLTQILVQEGETVEVGTKLAVIGGAAAAPRRAAAGRPSPWRRPSPSRQPAPAAEAAAGRRAGARRPALRSRRRQRQDVRLAGRRADRGRARRRPGRGSRHRPRRPRDEEGHPRVRRVAARSRRPAAATAAGAGSACARRHLRTAPAGCAAPPAARAPAQPRRRAGETSSR